MSRGVFWTMCSPQRTLPLSSKKARVGSLSIIGLPPFGGVWSKWHLALGAAEGENFLYIAVLMISSLLSIGYLMPVVVRAFFYEEDPDEGHGHEGDGHGEGHGPAAAGIREAPLFCVVPLCITAFGCLMLFFFADDLYRLLAPIGGGAG